MRVGGKKAFPDTCCPIPKLARLNALNHIPDYYREPLRNNLNNTNYRTITAGPAAGG